jgi:hypothetical protein
MRLLRFVLSHSIFIALCAAALCYQTCALLNIPLNVHAFGLVFFATLGSYNFYWLLSKYHYRGQVGPLQFLLVQKLNLAFIGIASIGALFFTSNLPHLFPHALVATILTLLYSLPLWPVKRLAFFRRMGFMKPVLLSLTWSYVTVTIPAQSPLFVWTYPESLLFITRFLFILMLCIIFDARDVESDRAHSVHSLSTDLSHSTLRQIMLIVFVLYIFSGLSLRLVFDDIEHVLAFLVTGILTITVYRLSMTPRGYVFYFLFVDGLMLVSALATLTARQLV